MRTQLVLISAILSAAISESAKLRHFYSNAQEHEIHLEHFLAENSGDGNCSRHHGTDGTFLDRKVKKLGRCRRYVQSYYNYPPIVRPPIVRPPIVNPCYQYPNCQRLRYCGYCPTAQCRRYCCPNGGPSTAVPTLRSPITVPPCNCDQDGSLFPNCDKSGQCRCKPHYVGLKCEKCENGFWKNGGTCTPCACHPHGSSTPTCHPQSGTCSCKAGVGGNKCDTCLPNHYGEITKGCHECDPCSKPGHICDPQNGKCVCPPLTTGDQCEICKENAWGHEPGLGCKACNCSSSGSASPQCDAITGRCVCKTGFEGEKCPNCSYGFYGAGKCLKCECAREGTRSEDCQYNSCRCSEQGCRCKENVHGRNCDQCKDGSFGLDAQNALGCTDCFCFGRSTKCTAASFTLDTIRSSVLVEEPCILGSGLCWSLPEKFTGDLTLTYGEYFSAGLKSPYRVLLQGVHHKVILEAQTEGKDIKMVETNWVLKKNNENKLPCSNSMTRDCFMVLLQGITKIQIDPEEKPPTFEVVLNRADLSKPGLRSTIEKCECPKEYTSNSCQDPNTGYYRYFPSDLETNSYIDNIVGVARPCACNGRSKTCDKTTGHCLNCTTFTTGPHCESCAEGYYQDATGTCAPCACPTTEQNFAQTCAVSGKHRKLVCVCRKGYAGATCEMCDNGFWGNPLKKGGSCQPCNCNRHGSTNHMCDQTSGVCECKRGFKGKTCSRCSSPRQVIQNGVCTACDECTDILFNTIDNLTLGVDGALELFKNGVGPPWPALNETLRRYNLLSSEFTNKIDEAEECVTKANITQIESHVERIKKDLRRDNQTLKLQLKDLGRLYSESKETSQKVDDLNLQIEMIVSSLEEFRNSHVNTNGSVVQAKKNLTDIQQRLETVPTVDDYKGFMEKCRQIAQKVGEIYKRKDLDLEDIKKKLEDVKKRSGDLNGILDRTQRLTTATDLKNKRNSKRIESLRNITSAIHAKNALTNQELEDLVKKINVTTTVLLEIEKIHSVLARMDLESAAEEVAAEDSLDHYTILTEVVHHVRKLQNQIKDYKNLFNFTTEEWTKINASGAYDTIRRDIQHANSSAQEARRTIIQMIGLLQPAGEDPLIDKTNLAKAFSDRLRQRSKNLQKPIEEFIIVKGNWTDLRRGILRNGDNNNDLGIILSNMNQQIDSMDVDKLIAAKDAALNVSERMAAIEREIKNPLEKFELDKQYFKYVNLTSADEIRKLMTTINATREDLKAINLNETYLDTIQNINKKTNHTSNFLESINAQIKALKNKIRYAKEAAEAIDYIGISISNKCRRTYTFDSAILQTLAIYFKYQSYNLLEIRTNDKFLKIDVHDSNLTLNWNNQTITVSTNTNPKTNISNVVIERIGSTIYVDKKKTTIIDNDIFLVNSSSTMVIGPGNNQSEIHKILFNGQTIGLWKFETTEGKCPGVYRDTVNGTDPIFYGGKGYRRATNAVTSLMPNQIKLNFAFKTFDYNALIYLARDQNNDCSYIALTLEDGYVQLKVRHIDNTMVALKTNKTYNTGQDVTASIAMNYGEGKQTYILNVSFSKSLNIEYLPKKNEIKKMNLFKIKKSDIWIGGVPATFNTACLDFSTNSLLGFLMSEEPGYNNEEITTSYNTRRLRQDAELQLTKAWFSGHGFAKLNLKPAKITRLNFVLRSPNGFVMGLKSLGVFVKNNQLWMKFPSENRNTGLNLDAVSMVEILVKDKKHIDVSVNGRDAPVDFIEDLKINKEKILWLGRDESGIENNFTGGINSIFVNNEAVKFSVETLEGGGFEGVEIGREYVVEAAPMVSEAPEITMKEIQNTEGCHNAPGHVTHPDTIKFGDKVNSYMFVKSAFWRREYVVEFHFRTFYPNGLLFVATGSNQQYNILEIHDRKIRLRIKGRREKILTIPDRDVNDGHWHSIKIFQKGLKKRRKLTIVVDNNIKKSFRAPKNNVKGELYVGGVPPEFNFEMRHELHPFRGCMRSFKINDEPQVLIKFKKTVSYKNVGQCFLNVEKGAYFNGDAFAVYRGDFKVNKILELSFEFRTDEQNGILLSVSNRGNSPALSVELQSGAVVMTIDMGNGAVSNVTNNLDSDFTLCNNRWHNITAMYSSSELTVNVDGIRKSWVQSDINSLMNEIEAPLYVGGLPENAPSGTLKIKENFKGCIRKLKIEEDLLDWTDMKELNNVLLDSCPV